MENEFVSRKIYCPPRRRSTKCRVDSYGSLEFSNSLEQSGKHPYLLDVIIRESSSILQLLTCKDQALLIWWDTFLVLDFRLHIVDGVRRFDFKGDGFAGKCFHKNLHTTTKTKYQMEGRLL